MAEDELTTEEFARWTILAAARSCATTPASLAMVISSSLGGQARGAPGPL
jgi:hypothetical protein